VHLDALWRALMSDTRVPLRSSRNVPVESLGSERRVLRTRARVHTALCYHERDIAEYSKIRRKVR